MTRFLTRIEPSRLYLLAATANVWVIAGVLAAAIAVQFALGELPCRLCLYQRIALMLCALGPLHMLFSARDGDVLPRDVATGCGMAILAALFGIAASGRQVLLHILPGDAGYGLPVFGLHLYTWCLIAFFCQIAASAVMLAGTAMIEQASERCQATVLAHRSAIALGAIVALNLVLVFAEAGFHWDVPEDPVRYLLFGSGS